MALGRAVRQMEVEDQALDLSIYFGRWNLFREMEVEDKAEQIPLQHRDRDLAQLRDIPHPLPDGRWTG